jgi:Mrp family chromosome partitioning ATPase
MDFGYLIRILDRRKWLILSAMLVASVATYLFLSRRPQRFKATVVMSTGIVNYKGINSDKSDAFVQPYQIENAFSNLIEFTQSRPAIKLMTIDLVKHDLTAAGQGPDKPFRQPNPGLVGMAGPDFSEKSKSLLPEIAKINLDSITDPTFPQQFDYLLDRVSRAYGYDHDAFKQGFSVKRKGETDYLTIDVTTENPALAQYMANSYANRFVNYYRNLAVREKRKNLEALTKLAGEKKRVVDSLVDLRFEYLKSKNLPALGKQSEELVSQIAKLEIEQQHAKARKQSAAASVKQIDKYMGDRTTRDARETQGRVADKNNTDEQYERLRELTRQSVEAGGKDPDIESQVAEAKADLEKSVRSSARAIGKTQREDFKHTKEDLYKEKVSTDLEGIEASGSADQLSREIFMLKGKLSGMVTSDEVSTRLQADGDRADKEFQEADKNRLAAKMNLENAVTPLTIVESAQMPEAPESNHKSLLSVFAAIVTGTFACILLFGLAYLDNTIQSPDMFKKYTEGLPLLGSVNSIPVKGLNFNEVFSSNGNMPQYTVFREGLRKIRNQLLQSKDRIYLIASTKDGEGKTFTMFGLAYSLAANNKKVLMLDTNFKTPIPESFTSRPTPNSAVLNQAIQDHGLTDVFESKQDGPAEGDSALIDLIGNTGLHKSPSELLESAAFRSFLQALLGHYDYILMESASLNRYSDTQELAPFADRILAVFNAKSVIKSTDKESLQFLRDLKERFAGAILTETGGSNS